MDEFSETNVWSLEPTPWGVYIYSVVIPAISTLGVAGNALILAVLSRKSLKASTYTYLAVLAGADLVTCGLLIFSGLARGVFWGKRGWLEFDAFVHLPVGSVSSNIAAWAAVCVTLDRLVLVSGPPRIKPPKFCSEVVARRFMMCSSFCAIVFNIPYCFIYEYNEKGQLTTTRFFSSWIYLVQNWFQLAMFGFVPAIFLFVGNAAMCVAVRRIMKHRQILLQRKCTREGNCLQDQVRLTITLVGIVFMFLVGEVPTHFASRRSAVSILYGGDASRVDENFLEKFRIIATLLNAISSSANFILYCLLSPQFLVQLKLLMTSQRALKNRGRDLKMIFTVDIHTNESRDCTTNSQRCRSAMF
ncbi:uncharacterized protein LOC105687427 [Athalia rosae]|uniref:uncharacterized protein LOC105687427 n=1 Tax=Athalia rosae TaxID=37344 RepID=UPI000626D754|nr:uncharacterized protein LOC105687427 [Athalia rosae]XP_048510542.1 uncharacterized protein LOC105687427 [Athalia rosae]XP_048510543.1 uncharacterized protein LOC105687427 [Athalia rosae]XP_048510544.1 uncharacterized protein LOC105687427 [Athalia rosae]XP_048510545.1 uncharacterized protein LOC105687427 [Athalia rosae]XP_048510546.1 uncharacterized protein LOC105687427 [Athalia rosae]